MRGVRLRAVLPLGSVGHGAVLRWGVAMVVLVRALGMVDVG
ncbi:hypothetical protein LV79_004033 [Actinokineospora globicatena]|nr:hypothetical protein [Actinokineospora globicatena]GLW78311.1 hypothetical protein Aglo01_27930 [Actinokineospora globicatena]GLW85025.1 hypothetical protein Aglo02_26650 [Actinokineospora globicatena]